MIYYRSWQEALIWFVEHFGHNYKDTYVLIEEFEHKLQQNSKGTYYMYTGEKK